LYRSEAATGGGSTFQSSFLGPTKHAQHIILCLCYIDTAPQ